MKRFLYLSVFISRLFAEKIKISQVDYELDETNCFEVVQTIKDSTISTFQQLKDKKFATLQLDRNCKVSNEDLSEAFNDVSGNTIYTKKVSVVKCN